MGFRAGDPIPLRRERIARDTRDQLLRAQHFERLYLEALNNIQDILNRPESVGDFVQDMEDIQREITHARQARW